MIITNIKDSIVKKIKSSYPTYEVYDEIVKQGFQEPCFFVKIIEQNTTKESKNRFKFNIMFDIHCFLDENTETLNEQYHAIAENLYEKLDVFTDLSGGYLRGNDKRHDIQDKVMHFFVDVSASTKIPVTGVSMATLEANSYIKD
jgi:hypothetical protein